MTVAITFEQNDFSKIDKSKPLKYRADSGNTIHGRTAEINTRAVRALTD